MGVRIHYTKYLNIPYPDRKRFEKFIRLCTVDEMYTMIRNNEKYINENLGELDLHMNEITPKVLNRLIRVRSLGYSFILDFNPMVFHHKKSLRTLLNIFDYGSRITGLPKPIFNPILTYMKDHIGEYYLKYMGAVK